MFVLGVIVESDDSQHCGTECWNLLQNTSIHACMFLICLDVLSSLPGSAGPAKNVGVAVRKQRVQFVRYQAEVP